MPRLRIGCSGWNYRDWRESFYPLKLPVRRWLEHYALHFDTVEVNTTFYRLPAVEAVAGWAAQTPADFEFTIKASRYLTHIKRLTDLDRGVARFYERIAPVGDAGKLGPVLWQLPANFRRDDVRLAAALEALPPGRHAFEFRDPGWFVPEIRTMLDTAGVALVVGDHPERPFQTLDVTADFVFVRFHYGHRGRNGNYSQRELDGWAQRIAGWRNAGLDVYAYFNNDWNAYAPRNAESLARRLA